MFDDETAMEETLRALDDLQSQGKDCLPGGQQLGRLADRQGAGDLRIRTPGPLLS
jgi:hypothetical protein